MGKRISIVYFSGTGGTEKAAKCFESEYKLAGYDVKLLRINEAFNNFDCENALLLLLYPVYALNAPKKVHEWVKSLHGVSGVQAAVISVSGGGEVSPNTACRISVIKKLEKKGYRVTYENMLIMPSNFGMSTGQPLSRMLLEALPKKVKEAVAEIENGTVKRTSPLVFDRLLSGLARLEHIGARSFGKHIKASEKCTGCGWCAKSCPSGNICMEAEKPVFGNQCNLCLCCIYGCPYKALKPGIGKFAVFKDGFDLKELEKAPLSENPNIEKLAEGYAWSGVKKYLQSSD